MLVSRRDFAIGCATAFALGMLAACSNSRGRGGTQPSASAPPSNQQEGAPCPADMEHLDQILAIGDGHSLPEDAQVSSVAPATNFAKEFPGGWGYIISFIATDAAIRKYEGYSGEGVGVWVGVLRRGDGSFLWENSCRQTKPLWKRAIAVKCTTGLSASVRRADPVDQPEQTAPHHPGDPRGGRVAAGDADLPAP